MHPGHIQEADGVDVVGERLVGAHLKRTYKFKVVPTEPNVDSLFHSLARHEGMPLECATIRTQICDYIEHNFSRYEADMMMIAQTLEIDFNDYIYRWRAHPTHGTDIEVRAYSDMFATAVVIWCRSDKFMRVFGAHHNKVCHLLLRGSHFQLLKDSPRGTFYGTVYTGTHFPSVPPSSTIKRVSDTPDSQRNKIPRTNAAFVTNVQDNNVVDDDIIEVGEGSYGSHLRRRYTFQVMPTDADGNCLFHSFAKYEGKPLEFNRIRYAVCDYIERHMDRFTSDIHNTARLHHANNCEYIGRMRTPTTWGTNVEVRAYSEMNSTAVVIWRNPQRFTSVYGGENERVCHLLLQGNHFQLLIESSEGSTFGSWYDTRLETTGSTSSALSPGVALQAIKGNHEARFQVCGTLHEKCEGGATPNHSPYIPYNQVMANVMTDILEVHRSDSEQLVQYPFNTGCIPEMHTVLIQVEAQQASGMPRTPETVKSAGTKVGDRTDLTDQKQQTDIVHYLPDNSTNDSHKIMHAGKVFSIGTKAWFDYVRGFSDIQRASKQFQKECEDVPIHPCSVCNTLHFQRNVKMATQQVLTKASKLGLPTFATKLVCSSCQRSILSGKCPKFSSATLNYLPDLIEDLSFLEERMVCPRIPFMSIRTLGYSKQVSLHGGIINIPIDVIDMVQVLPRQASDIHCINVQLRRRLSHSHSFREEMVRPNVIQAALQYLCIQPLFKEYGVVPSHGALQTGRTESGNDELQIVLDHPEHEIESVDSHNAGSDATVVVKTSTFQAGDSVKVAYAPAEGKKPLSILRDKHVEVLSFPTLFGGKDRSYGNHFQQQKVSYKDIVKWELMHRDRRFARHSSNLFFKLYLSQLTQMNQVISMRIRQYRVHEVHGLTAKAALTQEQRAHLEHTTPFWNEYRVIRGSFQYIQGCRKDIFAMIRQLGKPSFFITVSMADTRWTELHNGLLQVSNVDTIEVPLSYENIIDLVRKDPITCARYYEHKRRALFTILLTKTPIFGQVIDFFLMDEFQFRGSPHTHAILWCKNCPDVDTATDQELERFVDAHISCDSTLLPKDLIDLQRHKHTNTCIKKKGKDTSCRFGYPRYPMRRTTVLHPLQPPIAGYEKHLKCIKQRLSENVDSTFEEFLISVGLSEANYIKVLRSSISQNTIMIRRSFHDRYVNNYNPVILPLWKANMDIQICMNSHAVANYVVSYMTKVSQGVSKAMRDVMEQLKTETPSIRESLRKVGNAMLNSQEVSAQEAVYILLGLQLRKASRTVQFINTSPAHLRVRMVKSAAVLAQADPDDTNVLEEYALLERYVTRPQTLDNVCLAEFTSDYDLSPSPRKEGHIGPDMSPNKRWYYKRQVRKIIRFVGYNAIRSPEDYRRERLMLYVPFRNETELSNVWTLYKQHQECINQMEGKYCKLHDVEDKQLDPFDSGANDEEQEDLNKPKVDLGVENPTIFRPTTSLEVRSHVVMDDTRYFHSMQSLNRDQWATIDHIMTTVRHNSLPLRLFLSGGAGVGKSTLIHALDETLNRYYNARKGTDTSTLKVLKLAPTGTAAFNIDGMTVHHALRLPLHHNTIVRSLSGETLKEFKALYRDVEFVIVDEVSMLSNKNFEWFNCRLQDLTGKSMPFGGMHVLLVGDLYQLPPVCSRSIYQDVLISGKVHIPNPLWPLFEFYELTEIMRQKEDVRFAQCLNRVREACHTEDDIALLMSRNVDNYCAFDCRNIYFTNDEVNRHNTVLYDTSNREKHTIWASDTHTWEVPPKDLGMPSPLATRLRSQETMSLEEKLSVYIGCEVQVSLNIDVVDGLVNGAGGTVMHFSYNQDKVCIIWVKFSLQSIGRHYRRQRYAYFRAYQVANMSWTPFERIARHFTYDKSQKPIQRKQFPLRPCAAITAHRSQGQTYNSGIIHFAGRKDQQIAYVALSRFQKIEQITLTGFDASWIKVHDHVRREMDRLRASKVRLSCLRPKGKVRVLYQNVRSLFKYIEDCKRTIEIVAPCVAVYAESRLTSNIPDSHVHVDGYSLHRFDEQSKGMTIHATGSILPTHLFLHEEYEILWWDMHVGVKSIRIIAVYAYNNCNIKGFCSILNDLLSTSINNVVVGDFNMDAKKPLSSTLTSFFSSLHMTQVVTEVTTVNHTIIDHVWTNITNMSTFLLTSYYSDHFPLVLDFQE